MNTGIYQIRNSSSGDLYIGSAGDFATRWAKHRSDLRKGRHHSIYLQRAWSKYGEEAFAFEKVLICRNEDLLMYEQTLLDAMRPVYNICKVAKNCTGVKHTAETNAKKSVASLKAWVARKARGETVCETFHSRALEVNRGNKYRLGKSHTEETRAKLSASLLAKRDEIAAAAVAGWAKRRANGLDKVSAELRAKLSEAGKLAYAEGRRQSRLGVPRAQKGR